MQHVRLHIDRCYICFIGIFMLIQICLGLNDSNIASSKKLEDNRVSSIFNPKGYFISKIAPLFKNWCKANNVWTVENINDVFKEVGINAKLLENTIKFCNGSYEFLVYIPRYKKDFLFKYTPVFGDIAKLVQMEGFRLEVKIFSGWMPITLERLFG